MSSLHLSWFGGEPLLAPDVIDFISQSAKRLCTKYSVAYSGGMTTNGALLSRERAKRLFNLGIVGYQISLDGWEDVYDRTRVRLNGSGTFKQIWRNLLALNEIDIPVKITLRLHVTTDNLESILLTIENIKNTLDPQKFNIFIKAVENLGGDKVQKINSLLLDEKYKNEIISRIKKTAATFNLLARSSHNSKNDKSPHICYASKANSFIIRANGDVGKCTVALNDPRNSVGHILPDGRIKLDSNKIAPWLRGLKGMDYQVLGCPLHGLPSAKKMVGRAGSSPKEIAALEDS